MKIDNILGGISGVRDKAPVAGKNKPRSTGADSSAVRDSVNLSSDSTRLSALEAALAEIDVEDAGKVQSVRDAIASGTFEVDEDVVADRMVESSLEQLSHQKS